MISRLTVGQERKDKWIAQRAIEHAKECPRCARRDMTTEPITSESRKRWFGRGEVTLAGSCKRCNIEYQTTILFRDLKNKWNKHWTKYDGCPV